MREETTTLLQPCASRKETGFCSDCPREIYYFLEITHQPLWLVSLLNTSYLKKGGILCYTRQYRDGEWFCRAGNVAQNKQKCSDICPRIDVAMCCVVVRWKRFKRNVKGHRGDICEAALMVFHKAFLKYSMITKTRTHLMSTHIHLTFQLPLHANPSISD